MPELELYIVPLKYLHRIGIVWKISEHNPITIWRNHRNNTERSTLAVIGEELHVLDNNSQKVLVFALALRLGDPSGAPISSQDACGSNTLCPLVPSWRHCHCSSWRELGQPQHTVTRCHEKDTARGLRAFQMSSLLLIQCSGCSWVPE